MLLRLSISVCYQYGATRFGQLICKHGQILLPQEIEHEFLANIGNLNFIKAQHALADLDQGLKRQSSVGLLVIQRDEVNALYGLDPFLGSNYRVEEGGVGWHEPQDPFASFNMLTLHRLPSAP